MKIILDKQFWQKYFLTGQGINANITALYIMLLYLFGGAYLPKTDRGTLNKIHEAAKKEFLEKGFKDASLRNKEGTFSYNGTTYTVADLPGSYSLSANSDEEVVTRNYIASGEAELVCILADASQLERSLFMLADYAGINTPAMLVLTMTDVAMQKGRTIDTKVLERKLGIPVVGMVAPNRNEYENFYDVLETAINHPMYLKTEDLFTLYEENEMYQEAKMLVPNMGKGQYSAQWLTAKLMDGDKVVAQMLDNSGEIQKFIQKAKNGSLITSDCKFAWIGNLIDGAVSKTKSTSEILSKFDRAAITKTKGKWIAIGIVVAALVGSMVIAAPFMGIGFAIIPPISSWVRTIVSSVGGPDWISSLINTIVTTPLGWVIAMVGFVFGVKSVELVEAKLERYEQLGLVKKTLMNASATCGGSCKKCKGCNHENKSVPVTFWEKV